MILALKLLVNTLVWADLQELDELGAACSRG